MEIRKEKAKRHKDEIRDYILDCIDSKGYGIVTNTPEEKLKFLRDTFMKEYGHQLPYCKNWQNTFINWCMGLPSCFNVDFENYEILKLMKRWYRDTKTVATEERILETYWNILYMETNQLLKTYKLPALGE